MKTKLCIAIMAALLTTGGVAYGQGNFLKQLGSKVAKEVVNNVKSGVKNGNNQSSNNTKYEQRSAIEPKQQVEKPKSTNKQLFPVTSNTYRNPIVIEETDSKIDFEINGVGYSANRLDHTCTVLGPEYDYIKKLKEVTIVESILYNNLVYKVTSIKPSAFHKEVLTSVTFPQTLEKIGDGAFSYSRLAGTVVIPGSVKYLGSACFEGSNITKVVFESGLATPDIRNEAFENCKCLEEVKLPVSVKDLGDFCFQNNIALKKVSLPTNITTLSRNIFANCTALESITIPNSVVTIEQNAFSGCGLREAFIPEGVKRIDDSAFNGSKISMLFLPKSVEKIGQWAFSECKNLKYVSIPIRFKDALTIVEIFDNNNPNLVHTSGNPDDWKAFHWIE